MWLGRLVFFASIFVAYVEPKLFFRLRAGKFSVQPLMKALDIFPNGITQFVCVDFACKGRECTREHCAFVHPGKVGDLKKETVNAIGKHFLEKRVGWFNEWHFLKVKHELPEKFKSLMGGKDSCSSKMD